MKKLLIILCLFFSCLTSEAQFSGQSDKTIYIDWQLSNEGCYGCPSFYWGVTRSVSTTKDGYYIFDMWFYSNSTYTNGAWASTYVWGITLTIDNQLLNSEPTWILFKESFSPTTLRFKTRNSAPYVRIKWQGSKVS